MLQLKDPLKNASIEGHVQEIHPPIEGPLQKIHPSIEGPLW
jgi:hypothetical protein